MLRLVVCPPIVLFVAEAFPLEAKMFWAWSWLHSCIKSRSYRM